jgi:hypothetical protein
MPSKKESTDGWEKIWNARLKGLTQVLGKSENKVFHAFFPFQFGGFADVLTFPNFIRGKTYVTADCSGPGTGQLRTRLGNYELMTCTKKPSAAAADFISKLASFTLQARLQPGDTMEFPRRQPGSTLKGLVFTHPGDKPLYFKLLGKKYGLLLCIGVTKDELAVAKTKGSDALLPILKQRGIFPYTIFDRQSVLKRGAK